jgi:hypothetical protein
MNLRTITGTGTISRTIAAVGTVTTAAILAACSTPQPEPMVKPLKAVNIDQCTAGAVAPDKVRCVVVIINEDAYGYPAGTYLRGPAYYFPTVRHTVVEDPAAV